MPLSATAHQDLALELSRVFARLDEYCDPRSGCAHLFNDAASGLFGGGRGPRPLVDIVERLKRWADTETNVDERALVLKLRAAFLRLLDGAGQTNLVLSYAYGQSEAFKADVRAAEDASRALGLLAFDVPARRMSTAAAPTVDGRDKAPLSGQSPVVPPVSTDTRPQDPGAGSVRDAAVARYSLTDRGRVWEARFGTGFVILTKCAGLRHLRHVLQNPRRFFTHLDLARLNGDHSFSQGLKTLDAEARRRIEQDVTELKEQIDDAHEVGDEVRESQLQQELANLAQQFEKDKGRGGRTRKIDDVAVRRGQAVKKALDRSLVEICKCLPPLADHLDSTLKRDPQGVTYEPDRPLTWEFPATP